MSGYQIELLLDLVRLSIAFGVFFVLFPRVLFAELYVPARDKGYSGHWAGIVLISAVYVGLVHVLVLLKFYDPMILLGIVLGLVAVRLGLRFRETSSVTYADLLRLIDGKDRFSVAKEKLGRWREARKGVALWQVGLVLVLAAAAMVRLDPIWQEASPFSLSFYDILQDVKYMEGEELYRDSPFEERGLHGLVLTLQAFSQVQAAAIVRLLGVFSSLLLVYSIYQTTRGGTGSRAAGLVAGALFGLAGPALPFSLEDQVVANPVLLAAAFALPAMYFSGLYIQQGGRRHLVLGAGSWLVCVLTSLSVAILTGGVVLMLSVFAWFLSSRVGIERRALQVTGLSGAGALMAWGGGRAMRHFFQVADPYAVSHFKVVSNTLAPLEGVVSVTTVHVLALAAVGLLGVAACIERHMLRRAVCLVTGAACAFLYWLWHDPGAQHVLGVESAVPAVLLAALLSVAAGAVVAEIAAGAKALLPLERVAVKGSTVSLSVVCVAIGAGGPWFTLPTPQFRHGAVEPSGYVYAFEVAQRISVPYQWTVVGHLGTRVRILNEGRFLDYGFFVSEYDQETYDHRWRGAIATPDVYVFVDKQPQEALVREELGPPSAALMQQAQEWCETYAARSDDISVFYEDDAVRVYQITRYAQRRPRGPVPLLEPGLPEEPVQDFEEGAPSDP